MSAMKILDVVFMFQLKEEKMIKWHSRRHAHPDPQFEFHYFLGGQGVFRNGEKAHSLDKGSLFLSVPDQLHEIQAENLDHPLSYYAVLFEANPDDALYPYLVDPTFQSLFPVKIGTSHRMFFEDAKNKFNQSDNTFRVKAVELRLEALILDLIGDLRSGESSFLHEGSDEAFNLHVEQALGILQNHVFSQISLGDVCEQLKITEEYLIRLFKRHMNLTPMRYLNNLKMETATSLLLNSDLSVKEISWKLGFSSQYHFSRNFKSYSGVTPTDYRANYFLNNPNNYHMKILDVS
jgi:AraC-like DNA-binding protein